MAYIEIKNITKTFPGVKALSDVSMSVEKGEVHALIGENGAGKSTMMKILGGMYFADSGDIFINGEKKKINSIADALSAGISVVYQMCIRDSVSSQCSLRRVFSASKGNQISRPAVYYFHLPDCIEIAYGTYRRRGAPLGITEQ